MSNAVIIRGSWEPAKVIAEFTVFDVNDASLADLYVLPNTLTLSPAFKSTVLEYTVDVPYNLAEIGIFATTNNPKATVSGDIGWHQLQIGLNVFVVTVTAEDSVTTKDYIINVTKQDSVNTIVGTGYAPTLRVYPNPTDGQLIVEIAGQARNDVQNIEIYDVMGRKAPLSPPEGGNSPLSFGEGSGVRLNLANLPNGIYFLKINNNTIKLIKQ